MLKSVRVVSTGNQGKNETIALSGVGTSPFFIKSIEGLDPVKNTINTTDSVYKPGNYFNSSHAEARNLVFTIGLNQRSSYGLNFEDMRFRIYEIFQPGIPVLIEFVSDRFPKGLMIKGYTEDISNTLFTATPDVQVSMLCHDPYFFDPELVNLEFSSDYEDLKSYLGNAPGPFNLTKRFDAAPPGAVTFGVMNGPDLTLKAGTIQAGDIVTINTDPNLRDITIKRGSSVIQGYTGIQSGTLIQFLSATQDHIFINGGGTTPGFKIAFYRRYLGL